jgi:putative NADPH-quinone reductase/putative sterol carrier protein
MKTLPSPLDVMKTMHQYIADAYLESPDKQQGTIQFCLHEGDEKIDCYFAADGHDLKLVEGISESYNVRLESSFSNWLALAEKRLNPVVGVLFRRLKFKGDVSYFKKIIPDNLFHVGMEAYSDKASAFETAPTKNWVKPKKVLLIDSSPRAKKGYTNLYCDYIENALREKDVDVNHILLAQYKIEKCVGCMNCWLKTEGICILKDDGNELYKLYKEADLVIYAFPLYAYSVPGMLKNFMDRRVMTQYPYFEKGTSEIRHPRRNQTNKAFMVFSICGFPSFSQFDSLRSLFKLYSHSSYSPLVAEIYRPGGIFLLQYPFNYNKLQIFLKGLRNAMHEITDQGRIESKTQKMLNFKIDERTFLKSSNKYWDNLHKSKNINY